jgi:hypothetical protein
MHVILDFLMRVYAWIWTAPLSLLCVLATILLITIPAALNVLFAGVLGVVRGTFRLLFGRVRAARVRVATFRSLKPAIQLLSLALLLSWV